MTPALSEHVVILHGIFRTHRSMRGLEKFLEKQDFIVHNLGYPSTRLTIAQIVEHLHPRIAAIAAQAGRLHFVGYSMGGLIIRAYLHRYPETQAARVVMLGTPNQGSEVADFLKDRWLYKRFFGPAGQQLITRWEARGELLGEVRYELGIIAGNRSLDPIGSRLLGKPGDGKVSVESTKLAGMRAHAVIPATHTFFPNNRTAWRLTLRFLREGTF
jgi:pimeloyl-ACP methyl ester carboxylesterase